MFLCRYVASLIRALASVRVNVTPVVHRISALTAIHATRVYFALIS